MKVWKDIGMQLRDPDGRAVMIDDARFAPVFACRQRGVVVLGHQGEPRNAWLPLEQMTIRGDREYFAEHPQYHMSLHPEWPSYDAQLAARDRLLDKHPRLASSACTWRRSNGTSTASRISCAATRTPPSISRRGCCTCSSSRATDRDKVRRFFLEFQDRILYGTDFGRGRTTMRRLRRRRTRPGWRTGAS